jgi:hypothetical protein
MTPAEYERRKQALEEQLRASIQLLQQGYQAQLRALEIERASSEEPAAEPEVRGDGEPAIPAPVRRRPAPSPPGGLGGAVRQAVAQLPAEFTKEDIIRLLGFTPERSSLHRVLDELLTEQTIRIQRRGSGRSPNVYRKLT